MADHAVMVNVTHIREEEDHSRHVILHQSAKVYRNRTPSAEENDVMSIFKMADLSHLRFLGCNNGFFEKPMYDFLLVVNRHHSSKLLSF